MLFQRKDFHGGRAYDSDPSDLKGPRFGSRASLVIGWIKLRLKRQTPIVSPFVSQGSPGRKREGFSLLGSGERNGVRELDTKAFPMADRLRDTAGASELV